MYLQKTIIAFLLMSYSILHGQNTVGTIVNTAQSFEGYTIFCPVNSFQTYLIDNCGSVINSWTSTHLPGLTAELAPDGSIVRNGRILNSTTSIGGLAGIVEKFNWDGLREWRYRCSGPDSTSHHDLEVLANGNVLLLVVYGKNMSDAIALGRDSMTNGDNILYTEAVLEIEPIGVDSGRVVWRWDVWNHLVQDRDSTKANFGIIADHPERMNINYNGSATGRDWLHANSIDYNPELDQIVIGFRNSSEFWVIDHSTTIAESASSSGGRYGKGGDILYRWGNPAAYNRGTAANQILFGPHDISWVPAGYPGEGNFMIFNNGDVTGISSVEEFIAPSDSAGFYSNPGTLAYGPAVADWIHSEPTNTLFNSLRLSSAQRMPNGNTLICSGFTGYFSEIDSGSNLVWAYRNPVTGTGLLTQGNPVNSGTNSIFSIKRYGPDYPAFNGRTLTAANPLELNFNLDNCQISTIETNYDDNTSLEIFPNPAEDMIFINNKTSNSTYLIYNLQGIVVHKEYVSEIGNHSIDLSYFLPGTYIIVNSKNPKEASKFTHKD
jgi:hypothetical protein